MTWRSMLFILVLLTSGCRSNGDLDGSGVPYAANPVSGGFLLQTGHIQLGPRTGQNGVRWLGDGQNSLGFWGRGAGDDSAEP